MSLKGTRTHPPAAPNASVGSHLPPFGPIPNPSALASNAASAKHGPPASDGFNPDGRKKFNIAAGANCPVGFPVNAAGQMDTPSGLEGYRGLLGGIPAAFAPAIAACQFFSSKSPRVVLALMGRFRCRPPLKLYARLSDILWPRSCSKVRF